MIHLYTGEGKGKTTAAMGLALRMAGRGRKVMIAQFLKSSNSGERFALAKLPGICLLDVPEKVKFTFQMDEQDRREAAARFEGLLSDCERGLKNGSADLVVLDEVCAAVNAGLLNEGQVTALMDQYGRKAELVLTGRNPVQAFLDRADYVTEMKAVRHPYEKGISAREGVEF